MLRIRYFVPSCGTHCRNFNLFLKHFFMAFLRSTLPVNTVHQISKTAPAFLCTMSYFFRKSDTYFTFSTNSNCFCSPSGTLFHIPHILLTQNTFYIMIWAIPVHKLFTNERPDGRSFPMSLNLKSMSTEKRNQNTMDLDIMSI